MHASFFLVLLHKPIHKSRRKISINEILLSENLQVHGNCSLEATVIEGIKTTIPMHLKILAEQDFIDGNLSTRFMDRFVK